MAKNLHFGNPSNRFNWKSTILKLISWNIRLYCIKKCFVCGWIPQPSSGVSKRPWLLQPGELINQFEYCLESILFSNLFTLGFKLSLPFIFTAPAKKRTATRNMCVPAIIIERSSINWMSTRLILTLYQMFERHWKFKWRSNFKSICFHGKKCVS